MPLTENGIEYLNATEAAAMLGMSRQQFYDAVRPLLTAHHVGVRSRIYYRATDIQEYKNAKPVALPIVIHGIQKNFIDAIRAMGIPGAVEDLSVPGFVPMDESLAEFFRMPAGSPVVKREQIQGTQGTPYRLVTNWYPAKYMTDEILQEMRSNIDSNGPLLMKGKFGVVIEDIEELVTGRMPTVKEHQLLKMTSVDSVLDIRRINYDADGGVVMVSDLVYLARFVRLKYTYPVHFWKDK